MSTQTHTSAAANEAASHPAPPKPSAVEGIKESSRQLRGTIGLELLKDSDHFSDQDKQLLKFHGSYQQEDRDARKNRKKEGVGKHHMFMVRCKIPGGRLTAKQYLAVDDLAGAYANGTIRFTSRQGIQLHGVLKGNLRETIAGINGCLLTTLGACGDVERNVMACPAPHHHDGVHAQLQETATILAVHLAPRSRAYHEIWLNGRPVPPAVVACERGAQSAECGAHESDQAALRAPRSALDTTGGGEADVEPLYGKVYLPRKFKTGLAVPEDNCIDIYAQDLGLLAIVENGGIIGYNVLVGGGMGMTHGNHNTFPHLAKPICYVPAGAVMGAAEAVVRLFRDHGNRADRKRARIKYLVHDWGVDKFREVLGGYIGGRLEDPRPVEVSGFESHLGWHPQGNGKWYYGLSIENGRVKDEENFRLRSGLRRLIERLQPALRLTPLQDILLCDLDSSARVEIERTLSEFGILRPEQISTVQKLSMACPAIPTCGLAISESERVLPSVIDQLEAELRRLGLENEPLSVRMTGCPNGCARPYQSDIGLVGRSGDKYCIYVGGHVLGHRLNFLLRDLVPLAELVPTLLPLLRNFKDERRPEESFGDYCQRLGADKLQALLPSQTKGGARTQSTAKPANRDLLAVGANGKNGDSSSPVEGVPLRDTRDSRDDLAKARATAGDAHRPPSAARAPEEGAASIQPEAKAVAPSLAEPAVTPKPVVAKAALKRSERFFAGPPGEELTDYVYRYNSDGSVRKTVVYFYGDDLRAAAAHAGEPLHRRAVYLGRVDPLRLHAARKLSDTHYLGSAGNERRDTRIEYHSDGCIAQSIVFYYDGDARAGDAPSGAALRRAVAYEGSLDP